MLTIKVKLSAPVRQVLLRRIESYIHIRNFRDAGEGLRGSYLETPARWLETPASYLETLASLLETPAI